MKPEFAQLYHEMIETNQATAVTFVCQQELDAAGVTGENRKLGDLELTKEQRNTCRKVAEFMQEEPNKTCIQGNYFALSLLPKSGMDERHRLPPDGKRRTENSTLTNSMERDKAYQRVVL